MMTTMAAMLGALPLAVGGGVGSELRRPLGIAIVGGLIVSQMLTLYTTPVVYLYLDRFRLWVARVRGGRKESRRSVKRDVASSKKTGKGELGVQWSVHVEAMQAPSCPLFQAGGPQRGS